MWSFFKLIRFKNLIIITFCLAIFKYLCFVPSGITMRLSNTDFIIFTIAMLCIAAAGYIINDIYDAELDALNKPDTVIIPYLISEKTAMKFYVIFNILGLGFATFLSYRINHLQYGMLFLVVAFILLKYAQAWKKILILKNIIVALLLSLSLLTLGVYDIIPVTNPANAASQFTVFSIVMDYALFAFLVNLIREIVKDIEDIKGDAIKYVRTIPIVFGIKKTKLIVISLNLILIALIGIYINLYFTFSRLTLSYMLLLVLLPSIFNLILVVQSKQQKQFKIITQFLKLIMIFGIGSIGIISLTHYYGY